MLKKETSFIILGVITSIFLLPSILKYIQIPAYDAVLQSVLGDANAVTSSIAILVSAILILFTFMLVLKINNYKKSVE